MAAINGLLLLEIVSSAILSCSKFIAGQIKNVPLSFRSAKELRSRAKTLPSGPRWSCETLTTEYLTKEPPCPFYRNPIKCLQELLSHPLFASHISFVPRRVWTCAAKICRIYDKWLSGDRAWSMQVLDSPFLILVNDNNPYRSGGTTTRHHSARCSLVI